MKYTEDTKIICPLYISQNRRYENPGCGTHACFQINCRSFDDRTYTTNFKDMDEFKIQKNVFCKSCYKKCELYRMVRNVIVEEETP